MHRPVSGFYGELALGGDCSGVDEFRAMDAAMAAWGPGDTARWQEGPLTLGARLPATGDPAEAQPLVDPDVAAVGRVRIDNRAAVLRSLDLGPAEAAALSDIELVARAWHRWREGCVQQLEGDWVCAIWDRRRKSLWVGRDAAGITGLYYWQGADRLLFATSLPALLLHPAVPRHVDQYQIAQELALTWDPTQAEHTPYLGIRRLLGGHALHCDGRNVVSYGWWSPEQLGEFDWPRGHDYYQAFRELYTTVVTSQLDRAAGPVALMLSAGLDSGSIAALAAPHLGAVGRRLTAFTSVPLLALDGAPAERAGDEGAVAKEVADFIGNIEFNAVRSERGTVVESFEAMHQITGEPSGSAPNAHWILEVLRQSRARGMQLLLMGAGGNGTVSWTGTGSLLPALRRGDWRGLRDAFRCTETGLWPTLRQQLLSPALAAASARLRRSRVPGPSAFAAINPRFAADIDVYRRTLQGRRDHAAGFGPRMRPIEAARFRLGRALSVKSGPTWMALGAVHQLDVRDPTTDRRLIEFCWRVPDRVFWAGGRQRGLIRVGMSDALPRSVLQSTRRGLQSGDVAHRMLAERDGVTEAFARVDGHPLARECVDLTKMHSALQSLERDLSSPGTAAAARVVLLGLNLGLYLTRF